MLPFANAFGKFRSHSCKYDNNNQNNLKTELLVAKPHTLHMMYCRQV